MNTNQSGKHVLYMRIKTSELTGPALDWAVALAVKAWEFAHVHFPTMTLDPTFSGVEARLYPRGEFGSMEPTCVLVPTNPFRQDHQPFIPSIDWSQCGPLIEKYWHQIDTQLINIYGSGWQDHVEGRDLLSIFCRAITSHILGDEVDIPEELL